MEPEQPKRTTVGTAFLVVLAGLSVCMLAASVMAPGAVSGGWPLTIGAFIALVVSLRGLWLIYSKRDRHLY